MTDNIQQMKCPSCGAPIALDAGIEVVVCEYCGTKIYVDDEIFQYNRILKAQSEAKQRDAQAQLEIDKKREGLETRRRIWNAFSQKPIQSTAVLLCTIWLISRIIIRRIGLIHILIEVAVILWAMGEEKWPLAVKNTKTFIKHNIKQTIAGALSLMVMIFCITNGTGGFAFFVALCVLILSIRSAKKNGLIIEETKGIRYVHVKSRFDYIGKPCDMVVEELLACGFVDVQTFENKDLVKGWLAKEGDVSGIWINGRGDFDGGEDFPSDARVIVEYHVFKE